MLRFIIKSNFIVDSFEILFHKENDLVGTLVSILGTWILEIHMNNFHLLEPGDYFFPVQGRIGISTFYHSLQAD